ncbi:ATP-grasp domain-containing protein [Sinorhizobium meliloti]|uniref:ATP-grasp domain-containing protein n=1 Tax=Rhizobium meliloti TaxID=382 RepID=UPI000B49E800|nr:acetyl-CoA carboxylase biotin carboxylase subunit family protein [Sinorhizobium meliloti]ASP91674.1 hypothetical protein CDO25_11125 [Sinorhizobium meliloti]MQX56903.1 ATP-grasp domain-containing protein [Sinorhizobium meliloti]
MPRPALILLEGHRGNGELYMQAAQHLGLHPITLSNDPAQYPYLSRGIYEAIFVDTGNLDALIRECSRLSTRYDIAGITGFAGEDESINVTIAKLCQYFGLPGPNPVSIELCRDKISQRGILGEAGVAMPSYRVATNAAEVKASAEEIGLPVVLKPAVGSGSIGVRLCRSIDEVAAHSSYLLGGEHVWRCPPKILVEEYAKGPFYCAEIMGNEVIGVAASEFSGPPHFVFRKTIFPALLTDHEYERIVDVSRRCIRALGLGWGPANIEFRWTESGPVVIEVNPRLSGAPDPQLVRLAYGVDLIKEHIKLVIGNEWDVRRTRSHTAAAQNLVPDCEGTLDQVTGASDAAAVPGIAEVKFYIEPNTRILRKGNYGDCIGHVVAASTNLPQTEETLRRAVALISWRIIPFPA